MAYSDYGGYAYRNRDRVIDRSDAVLSAEGVKATPGMWPGFALAEGRSGGSYHVLLGDGPIYLGLHKQSSLSAFRFLEPIDISKLIIEQNQPLWDKFPELLSTYPWDQDANKKHFDMYKATAVLGDDPTLRVRVTIDDHVIEPVWIEEDNFYMYVRLQQPDGVVWHGWSGYGVGAGLEDCGYGFSTVECVRRLLYLWPQDFEKSK